MTRYIEKRDGLDGMLCQSLVFEDLSKVGFLPKTQIKKVYAACLMPLSQRQIDLLCQVLSMDNRNNHCYLEMISLLLGEGTMLKIRDENDINVAAHRGEVVETKVEFEQQELSPELKAQIELRLMQIEATVTQLARGSAMLKDQQVFNVLKECEIQYSTTDLEAME